MMNEGRRISSCLVMVYFCQRCSEIKDNLAVKAQLNIQPSQLKWPNLFFQHMHTGIDQTKRKHKGGNHNDDCCFNVNVPFDIDFHFLLQHSILSRNRL